MADVAPGITVLIATYDRAAVLGQTLEALTRVERTGIDCSIVITDNNSTDNTDEVVNKYLTQLPLCYLREPRPGKSCALNKALRECALKEIVVFRDDDVTPARNWFREIVSSVKKWPGVGAPPKKKVLDKTKLIAISRGSRYNHATSGELVARTKAAALLNATLIQNKFETCACVMFSRWTVAVESPASIKTIR